MSEPNCVESYRLIKFLIAFEMAVSGYSGISSENTGEEKHRSNFGSRLLCGVARTFKTAINSKPLFSGAFHRKRLFDTILIWEHVLFSKWESIFMNCFCINVRAAPRPHPWPRTFQQMYHISTHLNFEWRQSYCIIIIRIQLLNFQYAPSPSPAANRYNAFWDSGWCVVWTRTEWK